jgi:uncharacterized protein
MGTLQGSWVWYELMTPDAAGAKRFYEAVVGWKFVDPQPHTNGYGFITCPDGGMVGGHLELTTEMTDHGARPCWVGYIGVDDVDTSVAAIEAAGGKLLMPARDVPMAGRIAMVADPGGAPFYVMTPTPPPGGGESTAFSEKPNHGHVGWNELMAGDAADAIAFYTGQFGWTLPEAMDMGPMGKYQFVAQDEVTHGAIMQANAETPTMWNYYFWVPSIEAAAALIASNGGQVVNGPMDVPGNDWIVNGIDPQGAMFSLVGGK